MTTTGNVPAPPLNILSGSVMLYYCFDIGYEIELGRLEKVRGKIAQESYLSFTRLTPSYIQYRKPPLLIRFGKRRFSLDGREFTFSIDAKVYDFGVVTVRFIAPLNGTLTELQTLNTGLTKNKELLAKAVNEFLKIKSDITSSVAKSKVETDKTGTREFQTVTADILQSVHKPRTAAEKNWEDYTIFLVQAFDRPIGAEELLTAERIQLTRMLRGEDNLSRDEMNQILKNPLSYRKHDLTLIDWNSAFIFDPDGSYELPDIIEFARIQLLELRLYDQLLDTIIDEAYDALPLKKFRIFPFSRTLGRLAQIKLDISEIIDRLDNYLKLIGDIFLARVYTTTARRFHLDEWKSAVRGKLATLESIYGVSAERIQTNRMIVLEISLVILFVIDIVLILLDLIK